jgi:hypothetical protein
MRRSAPDDQGILFFSFRQRYAAVRRISEAAGKISDREWRAFLSKSPLQKTDYFTLTDDFPKAFRIGGCEVTESNKTVFQAVFFWKDDVRTEQREIKVELIKENGKWLINKTF